MSKEIKSSEAKKDYSKLIKILQIATGILMLVFVVVGIYITKKMISDNKKKSK